MALSQKEIESLEETAQEFGLNLDTLISEAESENDYMAKEMESEANFNWNF